MVYSRSPFASRADVAGRMHGRLVLHLICAGGLSLLICVQACAQLEFEAEPINYDTAPATDPVAQLQQRVERGKPHRRQFDLNALSAGPVGNCFGG